MDDDDVTLPNPGHARSDAPEHPNHPDAFGLTSDDWISLSSGTPEHFSPTAALWWALAGIEGDGDPDLKTEAALRNLLVSVGADVRALMATSRSSMDENVRSIAGALANVCRRLDLAAQIAESLLGHEIDRPAHAHRTKRKAPQPPAVKAMKRAAPGSTKISLPAPPRSAPAPRLR
jgi:hypothetical protein